MADVGSLKKLDRINQFLRALLFNFKMGLGLVAFLPIDAGLLSSQLDFPSRQGFVDFCFWFAVLLAAVIWVWRRIPQLRQATREAQFGLGTPPEPRDTSELLFGEVCCLLGLFLALLSNTKSQPPVGREWELGFLAGGIGLCLLGVYSLYRYANPRPPRTA